MARRSPVGGTAAAVRIRRARESDLPAIARIASQSFSGLSNPHSARRWVRANWRAFPRMIYWVAEERRTVLAYILWMEKGGFRKQAVFELEQIAVRLTARGRGVGAELIRSSLGEIEAMLRRRGSTLKLVEVTTGTQQHAVSFYRRALGTRVVATLPRVFRGNEYILFARRRVAG